ncbi:hypothetical protein H257_15140 [Aphanomyces astaci]|uniref:Uncharacterized protein n=1 Tax=Aphanomyces astaci TaxID=112090 RepID=W4FNE6_APHAT|nr:hypothetical protein H257_15140 [Aphanomyces astaci]ETV68985.1 hypothetical protein H257_15140 [Aphanomyces astaci]|eukprot:XP_009841444.1 hypothetical protein H257_15140 [Aphanomyces astaci]
MPQSCRSINVLSEPPLAAAVVHGIWSLVGHMSRACAAAWCNSPAHHGIHTSSTHVVDVVHDSLQHVQARIQSQARHTKLAEVQETSFRAGTKRNDIISMSSNIFLLFWCVASSM